RAALDAHAPGGREEFGAVNDLHDAVGAGAVSEVDAIKRGARPVYMVGDRESGIERRRRAPPCRDGAMDAGYCSEVRRNRTARLLPVESPVAEEHRIGWLAEVKDEDVVAGLPAVRGVIAAPADVVRVARVAFPPALLSPAAAPGHPRAGPPPGVAPG